MFTSNERTYNVYVSMLKWIRFKRIFYTKKIFNMDKHRALRKHDEYRPTASDVMQVFCLYSRVFVV